MMREERFEFTYINSMGKQKTEVAHSRKRLDDCLKTCEELGYKVVRTRKLYPFSTMRNQHNFALIANICYNTMWDMDNGEIPFNRDEYDKLAETREKAEKYFCYELPVAWVPWETYKEMKEISTAAICHRDRACALARERREEDRDYSPSHPWKAPGMKISDFIR